MRNIIIILFLLASFFTSAGQTGCKIVKAYAFYTVSIPGMQMADENGNKINPKPQMNRFIYVECAGKSKPIVEKVFYNNIAYSATITAIKGCSIVPGSYFSDNSKFKIKSKKRNSLWKIELQLQPGNSMPEEACKDIVIQTTDAGIPCTFKLQNEIQLSTIPNY